MEDFEGYNILLRFQIHLQLSHIPRVYVIRVSTTVTSCNDVILPISQTKGQYIVETDDTGDFAAENVTLDIICFIPKEMYCLTSLD